MKKVSPIHYVISPESLTARQFQVRCIVSKPAQAGQRFSLPAWIPGSYLIRDFARHILSIQAESEGKVLSLTKIDKQTWEAPPLPTGQALEIIYTVYATDLSVRGAYLDKTRGFFNGSAVFLQVHGQESAACTLDILSPIGAAFKGWRVATALSPQAKRKTASLGAMRPLLGSFYAENYDELIDNPVEIGEFSSIEFSAGGIVHEVAIAGKHRADLARLEKDLQKICEEHIKFFGSPPPMKRYVFLIMAVGEGYGGLEHRASTALLCSRNDLPQRDSQRTTDGYLSFLGLVSHEYFHTWNVKRIKPAAFIPYALSRENHTQLLWFFEGVTSYYDDLLLLRAGLLSFEQWLSRLTKIIERVEASPGRAWQSLAESSFDAWTKFYRPDENSPNIGVSYYAKGALVALMIDLTLRHKTQDQVSLDTLLRYLWEHYGKIGRGLQENEIEEVLENVSGFSWRRFFEQYIYGTRELPLKRMLHLFGIRLSQKTKTFPSLDAKLTGDGNSVHLAHVYAGGAAEAAGLAANDIIVAIDGLRATPKTIETLLLAYRTGDTVTIHAFRRDELMTCSLTLSPPHAAIRLSAEHPEALQKHWPYR